MHPVTGCMVPVISRMFLGKAGDAFVTGDWNTDGKTEIGVVRNNTTWLLDVVRERCVWIR